MSYDLWSEASRDHDAEAAVRRLAVAKVAAAPLWTFLANAQSMEEFDYRLDMASERLASIAEGDTLDALLASLREDFRVLSSVEDEAAAESNEDPEGGLDSRVTSGRKVARGDGACHWCEGTGCDENGRPCSNCEGEGACPTCLGGVSIPKECPCPDCESLPNRCPACGTTKNEKAGHEPQYLPEHVDDAMSNWYSIEKEYPKPTVGPSVYSMKIALLKVTTAVGEEAFVLVDEKSGYKVGGPFKSRAEAAQALNGPKFKGRHISIEKRGGEDEEKERGGKGNHDEAGGSKPFEPKKRGHEGSKTAGDVSPFDANGPEQTPHDGPEIGQVTDTFNIPQTTKPRQMPSGGGGMGDMGGGVDMLNDSDGMSSPGGMQEGGAANREDGGSNQMKEASRSPHTSEELQFLASIIQRNADFNPLNYGMQAPMADGPLTDLVKRKVNNEVENTSIPGPKVPKTLLPTENGGTSLIDSGKGLVGDLLKAAPEAAAAA